MKKLLILFTILCVTIAVISCGGSKDEVIEPAPPKLPEASVLVYPLNNEICTTGEFISETESIIELEWNASKNTNSYDVILMNLNTNSEITIPSSVTMATITLKQNSPYSWKVISKSNNTNETAVSEEWRFYNASQGVKNYAPFPASLINPNNESSLASTSTTLEWQGLDVDGAEDIELYTVLLGTENPPTTLLNTTSLSEIPSGILTPGTYYWSVATKDKSGNIATSQINSFVVN